MLELADDEEGCTELEEIVLELADDEEGCTELEEPLSEVNVLDWVLDGELECAEDAEDDRWLLEEVAEEAVDRWLLVSDVE